MAKKYARGHAAWGECGRCGGRALLKELVFDGHMPNLRVHGSCYEPRHPQETLPRMDDPVALYRPAPENLNPPTAPVLSGVIAGLDGDLDWTASESDISQITHYELWRSASSEGGGFELIQTETVERDFLGGITNDAASRSHLDTDTDFTLNYYLYYVIAFAVQGGTSQSNTIPLATPPTAPVLTLEVVDADAGTYDLSWTAATAPVVSVSGYTLYRSIDHGDYELLTTTDASTLEYTDTGVLRTLHRYDYYVIANSNLVGIDSAASNIVTVHRIQAVLIALGSNGQSLGLISRESGLWETFPTVAHNVETGIFVAEFDSDGGLFLAVGPQQSMRSRDGLTWTKTTGLPNTVNDRQQITWSPTLRIFVWVSTTFIATSPDGITWTTGPMAQGGGVNMQPVCVHWSTFHNQFILGSQTRPNGMAIATSPDGVTWTGRASPHTTFGIRSNGARIVCIDGNDNKSFTSDDAITFGNSVTNASGGFGNLDFGNGIFASVAASSPFGRSQASSNGDAWTVATAGDGLVPRGDWVRCLYSSNRGRFYSIGGPSQGNNGHLAGTSVNGVNWSLETTPPAADAVDWHPIMAGFAVAD